MTAPATATTSDQVRSQLVTALELDLIGPTQRVRTTLGADAKGLEQESMDRLPSSWYPTGFLVPTNTDLSLRCDDTADDDFAAADGVDLRKPRQKDKAYKSGGVGDDGGASEAGPAKPQLLPSSIGVSVLLPPGGDLKLFAHWGDYTKLGEDSSPDAALGSSREEQIWKREGRQEGMPLGHAEIISTQGLGHQEWPNSHGLKVHWHCRPAPGTPRDSPGPVAVTLFFNL